MSHDRWGHPTLRFAFLVFLSLCTTERIQSEEHVRFATFNVSLSRDKAGQLIRELQSPTHSNARKVAEILQRVRPDIVLLNEFDYDGGGEASRLFRKNYLGVSQNGRKPLQYRYAFRAPVNTGVPSGLDLDGDGKSTGPGDCFGFGKHPGHFGMLVLSRFPIERKGIRTFQRFLWKDMPGAERPMLPSAEKPFHTDKAWSRMRLSSKSHWDLPIKTPAGVIHLLASHPTPPVFDGPEDRNGRRNHDEIRLLADYVHPSRSRYIYDDRGRKGGLKAGEPFVIVGDLNADPLDGDSTKQAARQLTAHPLIAANQPTSKGGREQAERQGGKNRDHRGDAAADTADFNDRAVGNLRIDYVLPSKSLRVIASGVFWPAAGREGAALVSCSDHRLVWTDLSR